MGTIPLPMSLYSLAVLIGAIKMQCVYDKIRYAAAYINPARILTLMNLHPLLAALALVATTLFAAASHAKMPMSESAPRVQYPVS